SVPSPLSKNHWDALSGATASGEGVLSGGCSGSVEAVAGGGISTAAASTAGAVIRIRKDFILFCLRTVDGARSRGSRPRHDQITVISPPGSRPFLVLEGCPGCRRRSLRFDQGRKTQVSPPDACPGWRGPVESDRAARRSPRRSRDPHI